MGIKLKHTSKSPGGLVKTHFAGPISRVSDSVGQGWEQIIYIYDKFPHDAAAPRTTL